MSILKRQIRDNFRSAVFKRDKDRCRCCHVSGKNLDAHHITDRTLMPNGGYVPSNGISLCNRCHILAENFHRNGKSIDCYSPEDLYKMIGSSFEQAYQESLQLT